MDRKVKKWCLTGAACLLLAFSACRPEGILAPGEMVSLFSEFYLADASIEDASSASRDPGVRLDSMRVYQPILAGHAISEETFRASLSYYLHHPAEMDAILKRVRSRLEHEAGQAEAAFSLLDELDEEEMPDAEQPAQEEIVVNEGNEPSQEREQVGEQPEPERKLPPERKRESKRKRVSAKDLRRLEKELE